MSYGRARDQRMLLLGAVRTYRICQCLYHNFVNRPNTRGFPIHSILFYTYSRRPFSDLFILFSDDESLLSIYVINLICFKLVVFLPHITLFNRSTKYTLEITNIIYILNHLFSHSNN